MPCITGGQIVAAVLQCGVWNGTSSVTNGRRAFYSKHIASGALHHAYLISGPPGVGRRTLALRFAQARQLPSAAGTGVPCGVCRTCKLMEQQKYADLFVVDVLPRKIRNCIDQVRTLQHSLSLSR